ncbi:MAG: Holliday junction branch migration protein RuvA [Candidatus Puniceispirillum sp.]|nr:Holliday junction branch migration protein RuvA [Candidatus Puniceispirillum sp.]
MITKLKGFVDEISDTSVIIDVSGVGYYLTCSQTTLRALPASGMPCVLWTHMNVREDDISLFGFHSPEELSFFRVLTSVQGVGGRVALALLSTGTPQDIAKAILLQDARALTKADGVGPRLAARLLTELKDKMPSFASHATPGAPSPLQTLRAPANQDQQDAVQALVGLGYRPHDVAPLVERLYDVESPPKLQEVIRLALAQLSKA